MAKRVIKLTFPQDLVKEPLTFQMAKKYNILPNIRRAKVTETVGELVLELEGKEQDLDKGIEFLKKAGVIIDSIVGDILE
ncbi:MAG: ferredoxin [Omnitrophica WOR_2 bacterium GWF2_43_52]|nr:MAG: ferredoxin [Omnitrophica WOR_2 bacterium GWA2_44_7]OGX16712.1 MAG: ferredoxin [Omnitrophica WOR_2 bacterium GWC2_44_8]OGX20043.1 MAG: ferredoxin [Omnitrophica WOR_2 bacterium GWF2_43_52]OGX58001.1 MAG: ferredoxin [Omnitrophica WOR_2 bacterium RIFOXYC2_FULL_43_9]HAH19649.1 ferredoxin [Candidatus Omnitrophota bacterium]